MIDYHSAGLLSMKKSETKNWELLLNYVKEQPRAYFIFFIVNCLIGIIDFVGITSLMPIVAVYLNGDKDSLPLPTFLKEIVNSVPTNSLVLVFFSLIVVQIILNIGIEVYFVKLLTRWRVSLSMSYIKNILNANFESIKKLNPGEMEVLITRNLAFSTKIRHRTAQLFSNSVLSMIYIAVAIYISPATLLLFILIGSIYAITNRLTLKNRIKYTDLSNKKYLKSANIASEYMNDIRSIQIYNKYKFFDKIQEQLSLASDYVEKYVFNNLVMKYIHQPTMIAAIVLGIYGSKTFFHQSNASVLFMLYMFFRAAPRITDSISSYGEIIGETPNDITQEIKRWESLSSDKKNGPDLKVKDLDKVEIIDGTIAYSEKVIMKGVNISFEKNNIYCVTGESGQGKSTLIDVICGFKELSLGQFKINGHLSADLDYQYLLQHCISLVKQESILVSGTIAENIAFLEENIDFEKVEDLINLTKIREFLPLESGIQTVIDPRGSNLSTGQKQRIIMARALYKKPKLILLDEPTSNLDVKTETDMINLIHHLKKDMIVIIVSHKSRIREISDVVFKVENQSLVKIS
jgi:ATP-binding cassette subfamily C protein